MDETNVNRLLARVPQATLMPLREKTPIVAGWTQWPRGTLRLDTNLDVGLITGEVSGVFVVDCDSTDAAIAFATKYQPPDTFTVRTKRGVHFYFKWPGQPVVNSASRLLPKVDVRGDHGYVVAPGSANRIIEIDLPVAEAPAGLIDEVTSVRLPGAGAASPTPLSEDDPEFPKRSVMAQVYCHDAPPAIEGENGSAALFNVALHLIRRLELPIDTAVQIIFETYNPRCRPPWSLQEIRHKCQDARDKSTIPTGILPEDLLASVRKSTDQSAKVGQVAGSVEQPVMPVGKLASIPFHEVVQLLTTHPDWEGVLKYDVLMRTPFARNPPMRLALENSGLTDGDLGEIRTWLAGLGAKASVDDIRMAIETVCARHPYNAFVEYLDALPVPSEVVHLPQLHTEVLNSPDGAMASSIFTKQMVAGVRRMRALRGPHERTERIDHRVVVILEGKQETGKTSLLRQLAGPWYTSIAGDVREKDTKIAIRGKVFIEMEEMATARKADRDALKAFCSAMEDEYRAPYGRSVEKVPRGGVLFGTSNDPRLTDPTGNTRFAVIHVGKMCGEAILMALRDVLWAEANVLAQDPAYDHHLTKEEKAFCASQSEIYDMDIFTERMRDALRGLPFVTLTEAYDVTMQSEKRVMPAPGEQAQVQDALRRLGCTPQRFYIAKGKQKRGWLVAPEIARMPKNAAAAGWLRNDAEAEEVRERLANPQ